MASYSAQDLFGDFSDNEGFSDDENLSTEGKKLFKKFAAQPCSVNRNNNFRSNNKSTKDNWKSKNTNLETESNSGKNEKVIKEVFSGINMINPQVSSDELRMMMQGRKMVKLSTLKAHINKKTNDVDDDWVTIGIVVGKDTKVSKNGNEYSLWKLSDLKSEKYANLFLFGKSNEKHWKLPLGAVVGLLNATIMSDNKDYKGKSAEMCSLTLDDPDKMLHIGTSKDMGYCKAQRKDGQVCGNLITKADDEFCLYHIKNAYRKFSSKRAEIQSTFSSKEPDEYYFGNNFTPNIGLNEKNIVLEMKSVNRHQLASKREAEGKTLKKVIANPISLAARNLSQYSSAPKGSSSSDGGSRLPTNAPVSFKEFFSKIKENQVASGSSQSSALASSSKDGSGQKKDLPMLAKGCKRGATIALNISASEAQMSAAKRRAIEILKNKPIGAAKPSPAAMAAKAASAGSDTATAAAASSSKSKKLSDILKRVNQNFSQSSDELRKEQEAAEKEKAKLIEAALNRTSVNQRLVAQVESEAQDKYFNTLEKKEKIENRMAEVREMTVKVVTCSGCKYTAASQSDLCKSKGHEVSFRQATKRFFSCKDCKTHTYTLDKFVPTKACKGCGGTNYNKAGMIKDKTETKLVKDLLIRGEEVKFLNSVK